MKGLLEKLLIFIVGSMVVTSFISFFMLIYVSLLQSRNQNNVTHRMEITELLEILTIMEIITFKDGITNRSFKTNIRYEPVRQAEASNERS